MNRRGFSNSLVAMAATTLAAANRALAQGGPVEGTHYARLAQPVPTSGGPGKIEVIEFFWYGCPHCNAFEPAVEVWARPLPADVYFHRVPVAFRNEPYVAHQRIFFALEGMGLLDKMHRKVFAAIHHDHQRLDKPEEISAFMAQNGVDATQFMQAYNSFTTQTKVRQANQLVDAYKIDGVPSMGVQGRFYTSGPMAGANEKMLDIVDVLLRQIRKTG